jgi:hypothetical protein
MIMIKVVLLAVAAKLFHSEERRRTGFEFVKVDPSQFCEHCILIFLFKLINS